MTMFKNTAMPPLRKREIHYNSIGYFEYGRSMVEMLGTLAIMGILALTGVWVYNTAMDKLRADTLINEAQKRAVNVAGQISLYGRTNPTLGEFKDNTFAGGTFSTTVTTDGLYQQFGIQVSGVSKKVCQNILSTINEFTSIRRLSDATNVTVPLTTCADENTFAIVYNNDLSASEKDPTYCENVNQCKTSCAQCTNGACVGECEIPSGSCDYDSDCNQDNKCFICDTETKTCKDGCIRVEYLKATGTQWINTGVYINDTDLFKADYMMTFTPPIPERRQLQGFSVATGGYWGISSAGYYENTGATSPGEKDIITFHNLIEDNVIFVRLLINGIQKRKISPSHQLRGYFWLFALAQNPDHKMEAKMYSMQLVLNNQLMRDFVPVHAPFQPTGKQNCMFDRISKELFCNEDNTQDFLIPEE